MLLRKKNNNAGLTLIEAIIAASIFAVVMIAIVTFVVVLYRTQRFAFQQADAVNEARRGVETMVREIREAQTGEDGAYLIGEATDNEFVFYSDVDKDDLVERVRYFIGSATTTTITKECVTFVDGGSCNVSFSNFLQGGILESAGVTVSVEGDFGSGNEYANVYADGVLLDRICNGGCVDCSAAWGGSLSFDVSDYAADGNIDFIANSTSGVNDICDWIEPNHAMKVRFDLTITEHVVGSEAIFQKGITNPTGVPTTYDTVNEVVTIVSQYVVNGTTTPLFQYFDQNGDEITETPARPEETTLMRVFLIINVDPASAPKSFELESDVQLRNLKTNL